MKKNTTEFPNLKQIEQLVWRQLQETFSAVMKTLLEDLDEQIAKERDKKRYRLHEKSTTTIVSLFGEIVVDRNYYRDREKGEYVFLLYHYLYFAGAGTFSLCIEELAIDVAITGA